MADGTPPPSEKVRFATVIPSQGPFAEAKAVRDLLQGAEDLGYDGGWFGDRVAVPHYASHLTPPNWLDAMACCLVGAGATTRLRLGTDVLVAPLRQPVSLVRQLATADVLSDGRMTAGVGVGYLRGEFAAVHAPPYEARGLVTDEFLEVLRLALSADPAVEQAFEGSWFGFDGLHFGPRPVQQPFPIWVGGNIRSAQRRAALLGNGWHPLFPSPEAYRAGRELITALRPSIDDFTFSYSCPEVHVRMGATAEPPVFHVYGGSTLPEDFSYAPPPPVDGEGRSRFIGTPEEVRGDVATYVDAGVRHFLLRFWTTQADIGVSGVLRRMQAFAEEVAPAFR